MALLDHLGYLVVSDYFIPLTICLSRQPAPTDHLLLDAGPVVFWQGCPGQRSKPAGSLSGGHLPGVRQPDSLNPEPALLKRPVGRPPKKPVFRERPLDQYELANLLYEPTDSSFPSNLAAIALPRPWESGWAIAGRGWYCSHQGSVLFALAGLWSLVRGYSGLFIPSDVIAGAVIGVAVSCLVALALRLIES